MHNFDSLRTERSEVIDHEPDDLDSTAVKKLRKDCDLAVTIFAKDAAGRRRYLVFNRTHNSFTVFQQRFAQFFRNPAGHEWEESALLVMISIVAAGITLAAWWALS